MRVTRRSIRSLRQLALVAALVGTTSCSGDLFGGGGGSGSSGNVGSDDDSYFLVVTGGLSAIDPRDPTHGYSFGTDTNTVHTYAVGGEFDPATRSLRDPGNEQLVYAKENQLYSVDLEIVRVDGVVDPPEPALLATFSAAVEEITVEEDYSAGDGARTYVVRLAGGEYEVVAEQDGVATFPGAPKASLMDPATGAFLGWLSLDSGSLVEVDRDLNTTFLTLAGEVRKLGNTSDTFLVVDEQLMSFDTASGSLVNIGFSFEDYPGPKFEQSVEGWLYYEVTNQDQGWEIWRTDLDGPATMLAVGPLPEFVLEMVVLETRVVYRTLWVAGGPQGLDLITMELDGGDRVYLDSAKHGVLELAFDDAPVRGDTVYYYFQSSVEDDEHAYAVESDGSGRVERLEDGRWSGRQLEGEIPLVRPRQTERLFWLADDPAILSAVDPADSAGTLHELGELPPSITSFVLGPSYGDAHLGFGYDSSGALHVSFFDSSVAGSLYWVTGQP